MHTLQLLADVPYTPLYFAALGTMVARTIHALRMHPFKVIALDCDNTLWKGTCGEDGPENVALWTRLAALPPQFYALAAETGGCFSP